MVKIQKFHGYLAAHDHVEQIITYPYDCVETEEAKESAEGNPMSFYHVNKPEIDLPEGTNPYDDCVYEKGRENLEHFVEKGYLVRDEQPNLYVYGQTMGAHSQFGVVCLSSIADYENNLIKRHEKTIPKKE